MHVFILCSTRGFLYVVKDLNKGQKIEKKEIIQVV